MKLSIIVTCYNIELYIERCIQSIIPQLTKETELIIVNDGSTDNSPTILNRIKNENPIVTIINQENRGPSAARNTGGQFAKGEYLWFIDGDDYIFPGSIKKLIEYCKGKYDIIVFNYSVLTKSGLKDKYTFKSGEISSAELILLGESYLWNRLYKKSLHESLNFREELSNIEDFVYNLSISPLVNNIIALDDFLYVYERTNISSISSNKSLRHLMKLNRMTLLAHGLLVERYKTIESDTLRNAWEKRLNLSFAGNIFSLLRFYNCRIIKRNIKTYKKWGVYPFKYSVSRRMNILIFIINRPYLWWTHHFFKKFIPR